MQADVAETVPVVDGDNGNGTVKPSRRVVNQMTRVLSEKKLEFTIQVFLKSGRSFEYQSADKPNTGYDSSLREAVLNHNYEPVARWSEIEFIYFDKNI